MKTARPWIFWLMVAATLAYVVAPLFQSRPAGRF